MEQNLLHKELFNIMTNPNELRAERHDYFQAAEKILQQAKTDKKDLAGSQLEEYNSLIAKMKALDKQIASMDKLGAAGHKVDYGAMLGGSATAANEPAWVDARTGQPVAVLKPEQRMSDLVTSDAFGEQPLSMGAYLRGIVTGKWHGAERELRAMNEGTLGSGGYLIPTPLSSQIIDRVRNQAVLIRAGARTVGMESSTLSMARVAASGGDITPGWHTEAASITSSDMAFEKVTFTAQTLAALTTMSVELFEDAANLDGLLIDSVSKVLAIELDRAGLLGTGTPPQPKGLINQTGVVTDNTTFTTNGSVISASAPTGAPAWDWLSKQISALWSVNENPNAAIYSARTAGELDLLRASTGAVLPPPGSVADLQRLYTNSILNTMTQGSSNTASCAFVGDFTQAMIGMRTGLVVEVSRYANVGATSLFSTMQIGIRCYLRADFQVARPGAFRVVTGIL
jgi:HK97 family phage major capsid protein